MAFLVPAAADDIPEAVCDFLMTRKLRTATTASTESIDLQQHCQPNPGATQGKCR